MDDYFEYLQVIFQHVLRAEDLAPTPEIKGHITKAILAFEKALDCLMDAHEADQLNKVKPDN